MCCCHQFYERGASTFFPSTAVVVVPGDKVTPTTKFNFVRTGGEAGVVEAQAESGDTLYKMKMFIRKPWFIGTMGAVAWVVLLLVVVLLYRQRRNKRKAKSPTRGDAYSHNFSFFIFILKYNNIIGVVTTAITANRADRGV